MDKKPKTKVPYKPVQKFKSPISFGNTIFIVAIFTLIAFRYPIIDFVKKEMAAIEADRDRVEPTQQKSKTKKIKQVKKIVKLKDDSPLEEAVYVKPEKKVEKLLSGELKHHSFNSVVEKHCFKCHGAEGKELEGDFDFKKFLASGSTSSKAWGKIYRSIAKGEMPPEEEKPLSEDEQELLLSAIKMMTENVKETATTRVLTPYELENTMADLFDINTAEYKPFEALHKTYSDSVFYTHQKDRLSPYFLESYYHVVYDVLESFIALKPRLDKLALAVNLPSTSHRSKNFKSFADLRWPGKNDYCEVHFKDVSEAKYDRQARKSGKDVSDEIKATLNKQSLPPGTYKLKFKAQALNMDLKKVTASKYGQPLVDKFKWEVKSLLDKGSYGIPIKFHLIPPGNADAFASTKYLKTIDIESEVGEYELEFTLKRRAGIGYEMASSFPGDGNIAWMIARHRFGAKAEQKDMEKMRDQYASGRQYDFPMVRFTDVAIEGPYNVQLHPLSFDEDTKVTTTEVGQKFRKLHEMLGLKNNIIYSYIFKDFQVDKLKYEDAYRNAMLLLFMSPAFLELDKASREAYPRFLSYNLHKSSPNKDFLEQYKRAKSKRDSKAFGTWLIQHENFGRFIHSFAYQWLKMGEIKNNLPEVEQFGIYHAKNFSEAYRLELELFIQNLFVENRPVHELISADYSYWNDDLQGFYSGSDTRGRMRHNQPVKDVSAKDFKKTYVNDAHRGGLLGMGAFLTATGNGVDPLPIKRATWILENLLDTSLPAPPDDIDVEQFEASKTSTSLRERLEVHSQDRACYSCHKRIDPFAIIMDVYDTIGGMNPEYTPDAVRINSQKIRGVDELKLYLSFYEPALARAFCKKLISFMLGRELGIKDESKLDAILDENSKSGYKTADLYKSIIKYYFL